MLRIMFVCLGNICRSPLAQGVMAKKIEEQNLTDKIMVDSSGVGHWHVGQPSDPRTIQIAKQHGITLTHLAQQFNSTHQEFEYIFAMDQSNLEGIRSILKEPFKAQARLFRAFDTERSAINVPDPYFGGIEGFELVYQIVEHNCTLILEKIKLENNL